MYLIPHTLICSGSMAPLCIALMIGIAAGCSAEDADDPLASLATIDCDQDGGITPAVPPPPSPRPTIKEVVAAGDCKVDSTIAPDGQSVTLAVREFSASLDETRVSAWADCQLRLTVDAPRGQSYALSELRASGAVQLEEGVTAAIVGSYNFAGLGRPGQHSEQLVGPVRRSVSFTAPFPESAGSFSGCGSTRPLLVSLGLSIRNEGSPKVSKIDLTEVGPITLALRPCG